MESYSQDDQETSHICERWFKMPSRLWDTEVGSDPYLLQLLAYLCDRARIKDGSDTFGEGKGRRNFYLAAGELIVGRLQAAKDLKCPPSTVRNRLERLKEIGLIKTRACKKYTIVTIVFMVQQATKKRQAKKDNRKPTVYPANSLTDERNTDAKRTTEGQVKNERLANDFVDKSALAVEEKGQQKDNRRTTEGQQKDTNKKDEKIRRKEDERESPPPEFIFAIFKDYPSLPESDRRRLTAEILGAIEQGDVAPSGAEYKLRQWIGATIARNAKAPKTFDIVQSSDPSETDPSASTTTTTLTPSASSASATRFVAPDLDYDVKPFFYQRSGDPLSYWYEDAAAFNDAMRRIGWKRNGSPIDWQAEALRPKAPSTIVVPSPSVPVPSVPSAPVPSTLAAIPPSAPAKSAAEFTAELERATR